MLTLAGPFALSVSGIAASVLMRYRWRPACWLSLASQGPATAYDLLTHQYGFLLLTAVALPAYGGMLWRGKRPRAGRRSEGGHRGC